MSWHYSQALVAAYSADTCLAGAPFAPLSGSPIPQAFLCSDRMTAFSRLSRFGMTFKPLTADLGAELLMWFLAGSLARTLAQPEKEQALTAPEVECGSTWRGSLARFDRATSSWRTPQCSLLEGLDEFSETWPRWGMMQNGECSERAMSAHRIGETESGSWPTPKCQDSRGALVDRKKCNLAEVVHGGELTPQNRKARLNPNWVEWLMGWPIGWTDLKPLEMDRFQQWCGSHGKQSAKEQFK